MNLLLVNKTVMSCILVLQNKRDTEKNHGSTTTDFPTVIHVPLKVCRVYSPIQRTFVIAPKNSRVSVCLLFVVFVCCFCFFFFTHENS